MSGMAAAAMFATVGSAKGSAFLPFYTLVGNPKVAGNGIFSLGEFQRQDGSVAYALDVAPTALVYAGWSVPLNNPHPKKHRNVPNHFPPGSGCLILLASAGIFRKIIQI